METVTYIDTDLHHAATVGKIDPFRDYQEHLDRLLTPMRNTVLHIHLACPEKRSEDFIKEVLQMCPPLLMQANVEGNTPLHTALISGHSNAAKMLIEKAKALHDNDLESEVVDAFSVVRQMLRMRNKNKETALHMAARRPYMYFEVTKVILENEDSNFTYSANSSGESPLYLAAVSGRAVVEILDTFKSTVNFGGPGGKTALHAAIIWDETVAKILEANSSLIREVDENGWTPLHYAVCRDRLSSVKKLLDVDKSTAYVADEKRKMTALHMAACRGNKKIVSEIISKCPNCCELVDVNGWNVLHYAVISQRFEVLEAAFKSSSFTYHLLDMKDLKGYTPLDFIFASNRMRNSFFDRVGGATEPQGRDAFVFHILNNMEYKDSDSKKEILAWMEDIGTGPYGELVDDWEEKWRQELREEEERVVPEFEKAKDSHLVAAALVATVTFAAAFTLPGGYISDENNLEKGTPILSRNVAFKAFVISDAIAMVLSTSSVFIHFIMVMLGYRTRYFWLMRSGLWFIQLAMAAMVVAFVTGTYAVLAVPSRWLAITISAIGLGFFIYVFYATIRLVVESVRDDQAEAHNRRKSIFRSLLDIWRRSPFHFSIFGMDWLREMVEDFLDRFR